MLWVKAFHIVSVIAWLAALLYLPRLMVYHACSAAGSDQAKTFATMERRLYRAIATPAMIGVWVFGLWLVWLTRAWEDGWFHAKFACVVILTGFHHYLGAEIGRFASGRNRHSVRFYRIINEVPTVLMIAIVVLVVVKPF